MAVDKKFIKIKEDVLDYAMALWGVGDYRKMDPVVDLLLDVFAYEAYKIHQEIERSDKQILNRLSRVLIPQRWSLPYPAHALLTVNPQKGDCNVRLSPEDPFFTNKIALGQKDMQIFFSPLSSFNLLDARIKYKVFSQNMDVFVRNRSERYQFLSRENRIQDYSVWIGLNISDEQLACLDEIIICLLSADRDLIPFLQHVKAFDSEGNFICTEACSFKNENPEEHYFDDIMSYYRDSYIKIGIKRTLQKKKILEIFPNGRFDDGTVDPQEQALWIRLEFPPVFDRKDLDDIAVHINTFPVVNRQLVTRHHSFASNGRIVALPCVYKSYFLNVHSLLDNNGCQFVNRMKQYQENSKGVYSLFFGDLERFDESDANSLIHKVLQLIREEGNAFAAVNGENFSSQLQELFEKLEAVEKSAHKIKNIENKVKAFLLTVPNDESNFGELKYWVTQGDSANMINFRNIVQQLNNDKFDASSIIFRTTTVQGTVHHNEQELVNSMRYGLLTKERIVSREDIKSYIYHRLGEKVQDVVIRDGVAVSHDMRKGIIRITEVHVRIKDKSLLSENYIMLAHSIEKEMEEKSIGHNKYKICFE